MTINPIKINNNKLFIKTFLKKTNNWLNVVKDDLY